MFSDLHVLFSLAIPVNKVIVTPKQSMGAVSLQSVSKTFRERIGIFDLVRKNGNSVAALNNVSLTAHEGKVLVVLGPNGSGKSTMLKLISTMLLPDSGTILVNGTDASGRRDEVVRQVGLAVTVERSFFPRLTARENLEFYAVLEQVPAELRRQRIDESLELTGMHSLGDRLVQTFSAGMYQRLGISRALLKKPSVLLLDEPSNSLDPTTATEFWTWVRSTAKSGTTIILATHNFEEAVNTGDEVVVLRRGTVAASVPVGPETRVEELREFYRKQTESKPDTSELPWVTHAHAR